MTKQHSWYAALAESLGRLETLEQVIFWGLRCPVESIVLEVIVQDEYTHDVVMNYRESYFLVFDTN